MECKYPGFCIVLLAVGILLSGSLTIKPLRAQSERIGISVLLKSAVTEDLLADLGRHGQVLDVLPEIKAVTLNADASDLAEIQKLACVESAAEDAESCLCGKPGIPVPDFSGGASLWNLDAINVTDFGSSRVVDFDGTGVVVAVIDSGLPANWREYFPEDRIDTQHARAFRGGGGEKGAVSSDPEAWERDASSHGATITGILLGFRYNGPEAFQTAFNGVAPGVTVLPLATHTWRGPNNGVWAWHSRLIRAIRYVTGLKMSGELGNSAVVINASWGDSSDDPVLRAAIRYAIARGIIFVAAAGDGATMSYPGAYPEVISVGAAGWTGHFPADDPTQIAWILRDVPENDPSQIFIAPFSPQQAPGQDLDLVAPGMSTPVPFTFQGKVDYTFTGATSQACAHVSGVAALILQKNPGLTQSQVEAILEQSALSIPPETRTIRWPAVAPGDRPTWSDHSNLTYVNLTVAWEANATGHGLVQADAALAATPLP